MKTKSKFAIQASNSLDDIIFSNRYRDYGAFELRKKYKKRLFIGFIFSFFIFGSGVSIPFIELYIGNGKVVQPLKVDDIRYVDKIDPVEPPPPPPPPKIDQNIANRIRFTVPVVVDSTNNVNNLSIIDDILSEPQNLTDPIALNTNNNNPDPVLEDYTKPFWNVQEPAKFKGGDVEKFREWIIKNISYPQDAINSGISGRVMVIFGVDAKGNICDASIKRGVHSSLDNAVIRTIMSSPSWTPAKQNGTPVKQMFAISILFQETE